MNDLAIIPNAALVPADVFKPGGVDDVLERIAKAARAEKPDVSTRQGRKDIASLALKVAKSKTHLDEMGKDLASDWKAQASRVDAERRKVRDFLDALKEEVRAPLTKYEQAEEARVAAHKAALAAIPEAANYGMMETSAELAAWLERCRNYPARDWQEFEQAAADALAAEIARTEALHSAALQREAEAAELARLRVEQQERDRQEAIRLQAEREARIAAEAAEKARLDAEAAAERARLKAAHEAEEYRRNVEAEAARAEAATKAAQERAEQAERRTAQEAAEAVAAEQRRVAAARAAEEAETARRAANVAHKTKINREVLAALTGCGVAEDVGKVVIASIVRGEIPHVSISY